ncbi:MAG: peptide chain release factor N(5)-glutamine methyltransferase [Bacillota bacterium]|nr:peptide chain release factor N(5)-glutamine methyltransferase [Bacillota bacterium]
MPNPVTVGQLRSELAGILAHSGIEEPIREALHILSAALGFSFSRLYSDPGHQIDPATARYLRDLAVRRASREPLAFLTGQVHFAGLAFAVGPGSLVPRPDSEILVETARRIILEEIWPLRTTQSADLNILDTCTGSGCIGISLAVHLGNSGCPVRLSLIDIDAAALKWANINIIRHKLSGSVSVRQADLFTADEPGPFDLIVANPPYIESAQIDHLMPEVSRFEPRIALDGGPDGLSLIRRLSREALSYLSSDGWLLVEHGYDQAKAVSDILKGHGYSVLPTQYDFGGNPRVCAGRRPQN